MRLLVEVTRLPCYYLEVTFLHLSYLLAVACSAVSSAMQVTKITFFRRSPKLAPLARDVLRRVQPPLTVDVSGATLPSNLWRSRGLGQESRRKRRDPVP